MAGLLVTACVAAPYANIPLRHVSAFIAVYATAMAIIDLTTAALIFAQFWVVRWTWLLVLACGFLFTGLIAIPYGLAFPETFAPSGLLDARAQTAAQLSLCARLVSPSALIAALLLRETRGAQDQWPFSPGLTVLSSVALVTAIVVALTWATVRSDHVLPWIYVNSLQANLGLLVPIIILTVVPLGLLWLRGRSVLDLWLMVMSCAWVFDLTLVLIANSRYSVGWYLARTFQVASVFFVLLLFLSETTALYASLARASLLRRGARDERQIAMDVMAASIAHEIKQPLTALLINAEVGMSHLRGAEPGLEDARTLLSEILADGQRIKEIIASVRGMFKESTHNRRPIDVNKVVRDALATVDLELGQQSVRVETNLDSALPLVVADRGQLHQVFLNLITNAMEAMAAVADRTSVLTIASSMIPDTSEIVITLEDTGVGIPDKLGSRIFEPFFSTKRTGTGVGLVVCRAIVNAHGGVLNIGANKPHGTAVRVTLPMSAEV